MKTLIHTIALVCCMMACASCQETHKVKVTVVEEDGTTPVAGADVEVRYLGYGSRKEESVFGKTDGNGVFASQGAAKLRILVFIDKTGYYQTKSDRLSRRKDHDLTFVLRRIRNPIPLYAKRVDLALPAPAMDCWFDFQAGDWVRPHGSGRIPMCCLRMNTRVVSDNQHTQKLTISFRNPKDGIMAIDPSSEHPESEFKWLYKAPEKGYRNTMSFLQERKPETGLHFEGGSVSYALRVNTKVDENNRVVSANYVRISRGMIFFGVLSKHPGVRILYYFNPTPNDRNLEFDPDKNRFKHLKTGEHVFDP